MIALARETGLVLVVRSDGHSIPGHSVSEGGIVLDLSDRRAFDVDVEGPNGLGPRARRPPRSSRR